MKNENLNIVLIYFVDNILEVMLKIEVLLKKKDEYFFLEIGLNFFLYKKKFRWIMDKNKYYKVCEKND